MHELIDLHYYLQKTSHGYSYKSSLIKMQIVVTNRLLISSSIENSFGHR
jgi:hypothetical protein